jgi:hypothetical protein
MRSTHLPHIGYDRALAQPRAPPDHLWIGRWLERRNRHRVLYLTRRAALQPVKWNAQSYLVTATDNPSGEPSGAVGPGRGPWPERSSRWSPSVPTDCLLHRAMIPSTASRPLPGHQLRPTRPSGGWVTRVSVTQDRVLDIGHPVARAARGPAERSASARVVVSGVPRRRGLFGPLWPWEGGARRARGRGWTRPGVNGWPR